MAKKKAKRRAETEESFEDALAALEAAVADLEGGELGLDEALARYEEGVGRLKRLHEQLEHARRRIELLSGVDADGNPVTEPFDHEQSASPGGGKRGAGKTGPTGGEPVDDADRLF